MTNEKLKTEQNVQSEDILPEGYQMNLSDFALFLSVMKNKTAYESTLSIILEEPEVKLAEVKVEEVILNKSGKRAIRLDAWAMSEDRRQFNMEMQNDSEQDSIPKRSRYYQGLIDTPILKAGKKTRYKNLPSTVIIFITQDDIFGRDMAKYTFTEQCQEIPGLLLDDGTKKIFLNMSSKNGSKELISLLQYMKETDINNPNIQVRDSRLETLDHVVREVKESEEWEAVQMNILEMGLERGMKLGMERGLEQGLKHGEKLKTLSLVRRKMERGFCAAEIADMLEEPEEKIEAIIEEMQRHADWTDEQILQSIISKK